MNWLSSIGKEYVVPGLVSVATGAAYMFGAPIAGGTVAAIFTGCSIKAVACKVLEENSKELLDKTTAEIGKITNRFANSYMLSSLAYASIEMSGAIRKTAYDCDRNNYTFGACLVTDTASSMCLIASMAFMWEMVKFAKYIGAEARGEKEGCITIQLPKNQIDDIAKAGYELHKADKKQTALKV